MVVGKKKSLFSTSRLTSCTDTVYHCLKSAYFQKQTRTMKHPCFITVIQWDSWSTCLWWYHWMYRKSNVVLRFIHNVETIVTYHSNMLSDDSTTLRRPATWRNVGTSTLYTWTKSKFALKGMRTPQILSTTNRKNCREELSSWKILTCWWQITYPPHYWHLVVATETCTVGKWATRILLDRPQWESDEACFPSKSIFMPFRVTNTVWSESPNLASSLKCWKNLHLINQKIFHFSFSLY